MSKSQSKSKHVSSDSDSGPDDRSPAIKRLKSDNSKLASTDNSSCRIEDNECPTWQIDRLRFVKYREFKGKHSIDIREFYEKDGKMLPGRKGISLSIQQWKKLCSIVEEINKQIDN